MKENEIGVESEVDWERSFIRKAKTKKKRNINMETNLQSSEVRIPKTPQSPVACPTFKSSFARSLSFSTTTATTNNQHKPLDVEISFRIAQNCDSSSTQKLAGLSSATQHKVDEVDEDFEEFMRNSPLKSMHKVSPTSTTPTRKNNVIVSRALSAATTSSNRHRFQVRKDVAIFTYYSFRFLLYL